MKKSTLIFLFSFSLGSLAFAQGINDEITLMQAQFGMEKNSL